MSGIPKASFTTVLKSWFSANDGSSQQIARIASFIVTLVGCLVFMGYSLNIPILVSPILGAATMKANTALCFILASISLGLQTRHRQNRRTVRIAKGCAIAVGTVGILTLCQYLFDWNLGIDQLLVRDLSTPDTSYPGRMGDNTALDFALTGLALWLRGQKTRRSDFVAQSVTLLAAVVALLAVVGYAYNVQVFHRFIFYSTSMAFSTALTFLVLCSGILASRTDYGLWKIFTGELAGSSVARRLIPIAIAVPFVLGWLILHGLNFKLYNTAFCLALLVVLLILTFTIVILKNAWSLNRIDYDRRRSDDRLRSSEERLQMALQGAAQGTWDWDLRTQVLTWDDRCKAIFGLPPDFPITYEWHLNALHPEDRQRVADAATLALRDRTEFDEEYRTFHLDGTMVWVLARGRGYYDATGKAYRMSGTVLDISDRKQAEMALEERNQELDAFVHIISHDLKAPLRAISNLSQWIEEDLEGILLADSQRQMALLRSRVQRMEAMIDGLLDYARIGRTDGMTEPTAVEELLSETIDSLNPPPSFSITIAPSLPTFNTKRLLLSQVFANLIGNSIKHHDRLDDSIRISGQDRGNFYEFAIVDDGPGIAPEYHDKIFTIFQSGEPKSRQDSTGIGLSIVKKIVESEKGMIRLESELGKGTTFYVTWPKKEDGLFVEAIAP